MSYWSLHSHTGFSALDGTGTVADVVAAASNAGHQALAITDHGVMAGSVQLYREARKAGLLPFPGEEFYVVSTLDKDEPRYHLGMFALDFEGYQALIRLSSISHTRPNFHRFPRVSMADLAEMAATGGDHVVVTTGCFFGLVPQALQHGGHESAKRILEWLAKRFPHTYVELQHHGIERDPWSDTEMCLALVDLAHEVGLPTVVTQDSHYCVPDQQLIHDTFKGLVYASKIDAEAGYPGESYHVADERYLTRLWKHRRHPEALWDAWDAAQPSYAAIMEQHRLSIPALDEYRYHVPGGLGGGPGQMDGGPADQLRAMVEPACPAGYEKRMNAELATIKASTFSSYIVLVAELLRWCRQRGIMTNVRGSANGSLVCYLAEITEVDPIIWGTDFDRFMTIDRTKPPDIDIDIESERRDEVVDYLAEKYGRVVQIGTWSTFGLDADGKGSLFRLWESAMVKRMGREKYIRRFGNPQSVHEIPHSGGRQLEKLSKVWITKACGAHAGGFLIEAPTQPIDQYVPLGLVASAEREITQYAMDDIEALGYVKLDLLGLRTLTAVRLCLEFLGRDPADGLGWIPLSDKPTMKWLRRGKPDTGVFQFDGWTAAKGLKEVKPRTIDDLVLVNALYRPATINAGHKDELLARKTGESPVVYRHRIWEAALRTTWGVPVYQEQIMAILRGLGVPGPDLNRWLKALKQSNSNVAKAEATIASLRAQFIDLCRDHGVPGPEEAFDELVTFSEYSFNRAHAVAYALLGWRTAYLATNHPLEWYGALLAAESGTHKEKAYMASARDHGIRLLSPHVNRSGVRWVIDRDSGALRKGLLTIKGVGLAAAEEIVANAPYESIDDLIDRTTSRIVTGGKSWAKDKTVNGVLAKLDDAGALRGLG